MSSELTRVAGRAHPGRRSRDFGLEGRTLYLPQMPYGGTYLLAAAIRSIGFDAWPTSDSDERTLELGGRVTSGDECYPQKITLGDFLRIIEDEGRDKVAFLMPTANGPCRFGQYLHLIRAKFDELGYDDVPVISITSSDGYSSIGNYSQDLVRTAWRAVLAQDILMKLLLKTRPYEREKGSTDAVYHESLEDVGERSACDGRLAQGAPGGHRRRRMLRARDRFRAVPADYDALAAAHRRGRRDLLPPEHLLQLRPHPRGRGAGRRVLAVRHRRVGVVHRRRAAPPAHRTRAGGSARTTPSAYQEQGHARATSTRSTGRSTTTSSATRSRTTCARCSS